LIYLGLFGHLNQPATPLVQSFKNGILMQDHSAASPLLTARHLTFDDIPVIDFAGMLSEDAQARAQVVEAVRRASETVGFFYIRNHGVPQALIDQIFALGLKFFDLPLSEKLEIHKNQSAHHAGYTPLLAENTDPANRGDLHECFDIVAELGNDVRDQDAELNLWPANLPELRPALDTYFAALLQLGRKLFEVVALSLKLAPDFFEPYLTRPTGMLRINYYPPQPPQSDGSQIGIGAHTDYECFTILAQQPDVTALQIWNGFEWIAAPSIPGTFVVNIGDQMQRWTNDIFASTRHRAINMTANPRLSIPFFLGVNYETNITAIPGCVSDARPGKYAPVIAGEYVTQRLNETYGYV
jgi:isopenicillin N synthase-like dioxygenase